MTNNSVKNIDLADCTTNVFSLADIRGLHWKKYKCSCINSSSTLDDPILTAYTVALRLDVLCVWRRVAQGSVHEDVVGTRLFGCAKELVIFWYGNEPTIGHVLGPSIQEIDSGAIEDGISSDYLDLFFKSIHNIIEKNLLGSNFIRLGKWFTKPLKGDPESNSVSSSLAFRFSIFIHGESTVVTAVNIQEKNAVRCLCKKDLMKKPIQSSVSTDHRVLLAPYGLNAQLTGYSLSEGDVRAVKILEEWKKFFPINGGCNKFQYGQSKTDCCSSVVEVTLGEVKMLYPSSLVMIPVTIDKDNAASMTIPPCLKNPYADLEEAKKIEQKKSAVKLINNTWNVLQHKEEHMPETKLWDMKENHYKASCACCMKSNITRAKAVSNANPFKPIETTTQQFGHSSSSGSKLKKENHLPLSNFHQRMKPRKPRGRVTPSISGRLTPSITSANKMVPPKQSVVDKPAETALPSAIQGVTSMASQIKTDEQLPYVQKGKPSCVYTNTTEIHSNSFKINKEACQLSAPRPTKLVPPFLNVNMLDPMFSDSNTSEDKSNYLLSRRNNDNQDVSQIDSGSYAFKKVLKNETNIKSEPNLSTIKGELDKLSQENEGIKVCINSTVVQSPLSPPHFKTEDDIKSPNKRDSNSMLPTPAPSPSPLPDSPLKSTKSRKRENVSDGGMHPVCASGNDNQVFTFNSKVIRLPSPPTPHFSPTVKSSSLMTTKDLVPISDDLDHLFDDEEEENAGFKKISMPIPERLNGPPSIDDTASKLSVSNLPSVTSQQDLARMFPTPPSPTSPSDLSPVMDIGDSAELKRQVPHEKDKQEMKVDIKPINSEEIFFLPVLQNLEIPHSYMPLSVPSSNWREMNSEKLKFMLTWDPKMPPILSRRPSGQRCPSVTGTIDIKQSIPTIDAKINIPITSPSMHTIYNMPHSISPVSSNVNDNQSLLVNLTLTDSYMNWVSVHAIEISTQSIQSRTCELFNDYQNIYWKSFDRKGPSNLFPEDSSLHLATGNNYYCSEIKLLEQVGLQSTLAPEISEIHLKHFLSPFSVEYLRHVLDRYYSYQTFSLKTKTKAISRCIIQKSKLLKDLHAYLQKALQKPMCKGMFDTPKIEGPLSFKKLNKVTKKKGLQSILSANSLLLNYDRDSVSISPSAVKHWQHLQLEPYGGTRNVVYVVALPESDFVVSSAKEFFHELNSVYENLNLGVHYPIPSRDGLFLISQTAVLKVSAVKVDDWFNQNDSKTMAKLKTIAQVCKQQLGPYLATLNLETMTPYTKETKSDAASNTLPSSTTSPATSTGSKPGDEPPSNSNTVADSASVLQDQNNNSSQTNSLAGTVLEDKPPESKLQPPTLVIYMVDPFHTELSSENSPNFWSYFGFMRCFIEMKSLFEQKVKENILLEVIPLEQILQGDLNTRGGAAKGYQTQELKNLALSVYSRCRANPMKWMKKTDKCMTGFGVCNLRDHLIRRRLAEGVLYPQLYMPPYIIAEPKKFVKVDPNATIDQRLNLIDNDTNILFCSYFLSLDNQFLLVTCTDKVGELYESTFIKVTYPKKKKNKSLIWSIAIRKLWEFITIITSFSVCSWRIVISKMGNIGQLELKELNSTIQKHLQSINSTPQSGRPLSPSTDSCTPCSIDVKEKEKACIKSISVCTLTENCDISFVSPKSTHHTDSMNSRVYVMPTAKRHFSNSRLKGNNSGTRSDMLPPEHVFSTSFEMEDQEQLQTNFYPLLSPSDSTLFQTSPMQHDMTKMLSSPQNISSPQSNLSTNMASLSPFQPISNKQNYMTSPARSSSVSFLDQSDSCGHLSVGYILSGSPLDDKTDSEPKVLKCDLHQHVTSSSCGPTTDSHPLDSKNYVQVLKYILECFDMLSWLTVDPSTGIRHSCLPIHLRTLSTMQQLLKEFSN